MVDKLTNKIMGDEICNGIIDLSKFSPKSIKIISLAQPIMRTTAGNDKLKII